MPLKNAEITEIVESLSDNFTKLLKQLNANHQHQYGRNAMIDPMVVIGRLLYNPYPGTNISIEQININYRELKGTASPYDILIPNNYESEADAQLVAKAATIHLTAIAAGFNAYQQQQQQQAQQPERHQRHPRRRPERVEVHHYHHGYHYHRGYYRDPLLDFWMYQMIFDHHHHHYHQPTQPTTGKTGGKSDENEVGILGLLLAAVLIGGAVASIGYTVMETYYRIDEMLHGEELLSNSIKLSVTALAGWQGFMLGALLGATYFANPILGAVCTSIIASAMGMKLSKWGAELATESFNETSAHNKDPRLCLTTTEKNHLHNKNPLIDTDSVEEAIRHIAIMMKKEPNNGLKFWFNSHSDLIKTLRELKQGTFKSDYLVLDNKTFKLKLTDEEYAVQQQAKKTQTPEVRYSEQTEIPVAIPVDPPSYYQSLKTEKPSTDFPSWQPQAVHPYYQEVYPTAPSMMYASN